MIPKRLFLSAGLLSLHAAAVSSLAKSKGFEITDDEKEADIVVKPGPETKWLGISPGNAVIFEDRTPVPVIHPQIELTMSPTRTLGLMAGLLSPSSYGHGGYYDRPVYRYQRQRYEGAANQKQCARRRARNKAARKSRQRNRK